MDSPERMLDAEARARLDEHLDSVDRVLAESGVSRSDRRSICDEVEAQACEMAWARAEGEPTEQDMRAVLAELDAPEAYRQAAETNGQAYAARPLAAGLRLHPFALCALLVPIASAGASSPPPGTRDLGPPWGMRARRPPSRQSEPGARRPARARSRGAGAAP